MPAEGIPVNLVGETYTLQRIPKAMAALRMARAATAAKDDPDILLDTVMSWIKGTFNDKDAARIQERLYDDRDQLDITHIQTLIERVMSLTGNPTG